MFYYIILYYTLKNTEFREVFYSVWCPFLRRSQIILSNLRQKKTNIYRPSGVSSPSSRDNRFKPLRYSCDIQSSSRSEKKTFVCIYMINFYALCRAIFKKFTTPRFFFSIRALAHQKFFCSFILSQILLLSSPFLIHKHSKNTIRRLFIANFFFAVPRDDKKNTEYIPSSGETCQIFASRFFWKKVFAFFTWEFLYIFFYSSLLLREFKPS